MPELPLSLRLIGLRVTKLKDLREGEKKGIKRVRLISADHRVNRIPTQLENSFSSQLDRIKQARANGGELVRR